MSGGEEDNMEEAARRAAGRDRLHHADPEPSLGARLGQIGILGWAIVTPMLLGIWLGRWLDGLFSSGIVFSGAGIVLGAAIGFHAAWKWMHRE